MKESDTSIAENTAPLIRVEGLSKKYCRDFKKSLWYGVKDIFTAFFGRKRSGIRKEEFWAVDDISFEVKRGECLGLIGHNGAGKSTLLKMLNGIINPDRGDIQLKGRIGALIQLGAGFNPVLTGRENVFNYGIVLGFTHQEILDKYRDIIEFAELEGFMETPVQNYSSGMKVRLGFAVAAQMNPDVLIIDEVLAVGDLRFRTKCFNRLDEIKKNTAVILVAHQMNQIARQCTNVLLMKNGKCVYSGDDVERGIDEYMEGLKSKVTVEREVEGVELIDYSVDVAEQIKIAAHLNFSEKSIKHFTVGLTFFNQEMQPVASTHSGWDQKKYLLDDGVCKLEMVTDNVFATGDYFVNLILHIFLRKGEKKALKLSNAITFSVRKNQSASNIKIQLPARWS